MPCSTPAATAHCGIWPKSADSIKLIEKMAAAGKPVAAVCHAPGVLRHVKAADGSPLVKGKKVTGFTNTEEAAVQLTDIVPFLVEDMLVKNGGNYSKGADWQPYVVTDGKLITGQNPASSEPAARAASKSAGTAASAVSIPPWHLPPLKINRDIMAYQSTNPYDGKVVKSFDEIERRAARRKTENGGALLFKTTGATERLPTAPPSSSAPPR